MFILFNKDELNVCHYVKTGGKHIWTIDFYFGNPFYAESRMKGLILIEWK